MTANPLIRIVDDEAEVRDSLKLMLECEGWEVKAYEGGRSFIQDFERHRPGCVLLDVRMPDWSGPQLQQRLKADGVTLPVVLITSYSDIDVAIETLKAGAFDFLLKPVDPDKLLDVIDKAVKKSLLVVSGAAVPENLSAVLGTLSEQPKRVLRMMCDGLNDAAIAERLGLSVRTAQVYRSSVYKALGVHSVKQFSLLIKPIRETGFLTSD